MIKETWEVKYHISKNIEHIIGIKALMKGVGISVFVSGASNELVTPDNKDKDN